MRMQEHFLNRELQQLEFNRRVLAQAEDRAAPLLERLKFLAIVSSNMDEFFEIRVSGLKEQNRIAPNDAGPDGLTVRDTLARVNVEAHVIVARQYELLNKDLIPALAAQSVRFLRRATWNARQQAWVKKYFFDEMMPVLTPIGLDPAHPFPRVFNKSLNFAVELEGRDAFGRDAQRAIVQAPRMLPRVIKLPPGVAEGENDFIFLTSVLRQHVGELFPGLTVKGCYEFRVTRNSDLFLDEEEVTNLRAALRGELSQRHLGDAVRLEVADTCSEEMSEFLLEQLELEAGDLYRVDGPVNLVRLMSVPDLVARPDLQFPPFAAGLPKVLKKNASNLFAALRKQDVLLHHPFESFQPVIEFITAAARDPDVVAVKQTVYRTGTDSQIMEALIEAATRGKEVTVVVELMARFDEEANLNWASRLEEVGAHVVYGVVGYKAHAKLALVVRREWDDPEDPEDAPKRRGRPKLKRYAHLGTGNYHARTARLYTDFGLLTADESLCGEVSDVFVQLTGLGRAIKHKLLWQAPFSLHKNVLAAIESETRLARAGKKGAIVAKMNALVEQEVIEALYKASAVGVQIDLIVRGVCALRPGVPGLSDNIRVRSIVGRFLEHSRIYFFRNGGRGHERVYLSSADWMVRNFFRRIEVCFPVTGAARKRVVGEGLTPYLHDTAQAWIMGGDGQYTLPAQRRGKGRARSAQRELLELLGGD
ncbi:MAG: polyphosphate kinase 1 [Betaproteobacteria bacterium]|nr:polyphosphate kinase 1 [Betaproteobacteria bacterium]